MSDIVPLLIVQQFGQVRWFPSGPHYDEMLKICQDHKFTEVDHYPDSDQTYQRGECDRSWLTS